MLFIEGSYLEPLLINVVTYIYLKRRQYLLVFQYPMF
jgi:hypothetical protein